MEILKFIYSNGGAIMIGVQSILMGVIAVSLLIPGEQPEKFLKKVVVLFEKFSKK